MSYLQELCAHYAAVHRRLHGPMRRQFVPVPVRIEPSPPIAPAAAPVITTERERIINSIRLARDQIAATGAYKKTGAVCHAVAQVYGVSVDELLGPRRFHRLIEPRHVAMTIARLLLPYSLPEIARAFGGRDHTTAINAIRKYGEKVAELMEGEGQ